MATGFVKPISLKAPAAVTALPANPSSIFPFGVIFCAEGFDISGEGAFSADFFGTCCVGYGGV